MDHNAEEDLRKRPDFVATSWTAVMAAKRPDTPQAQAALERLCNLYWYPLYAYVRRRGYDPHDAEDATQEFFFRLLRGNYLQAVDRERGKFRTFLLCALMHFLSNERARAQAIKRGGRETLVSLDEEVAEDRYLRDSVADPSAVKMYEHGWASTLIEQVRAELRQEYIEANKESLFQQLEAFLKEESASGDYPAVAERVGMSAGAVAVAVHRLRQRYGELLRETVAQTLAEPTPHNVQEELNHLLSALSSR